jgi:opacity protein-like surface antigen
MKIATIVAAVALASGSAAFAADQYGTSHADTAHHAATVQHNDSRADNDNHAYGDNHAAGDKRASSDTNGAHEGLMDRTRNALHRIGRKLRSATHREHTETAMGRDRNDTRAMGAAGESHDNARQHRMDNAYGNYQDKHDSDKR